MYVVDRNDQGKSATGHSSNKPSLGREITGTGALDGREKDRHI